MTVVGPRGKASRVADHGVHSVVASWALKLDTGDLLLTVHREGKHWRIALTDGAKGLWAAKLSPSDYDQVAVQEAARHLARASVKGMLETPPRNAIQLVAWDTALNTARAFTERFGALQDWREEYK